MAHNHRFRLWRQNYLQKAADGGKRGTSSTKLREREEVELEKTKERVRIVATSPTTE